MQSSILGAFTCEGREQFLGFCARKDDNLVKGSSLQIIFPRGWFSLSFQNLLTKDMDALTGTRAVCIGCALSSRRNSELRGVGS